MSIHFYSRLKNFLRTTLIGGFVALMPMGLIIILFRWIIGMIEKYLGPVVNLIDTTSHIQQFLLYILAIITIMGIFFIIGLVIKTRVGTFLNGVEDKYLAKVPGYKLAKETVNQFFGKNRSFFSAVVLVDIFGSETLMTGFVTDSNNEYVTVFVPTGPNPTSGNIYHVKPDRVIHTNAPVDAGMKTIISCGAGSNAIFQQRKLLAK